MDPQKGGLMAKLKGLMMAALKEHLMEKLMGA